MPLERPLAGSPAEWLRHARGDLKLAAIGRDQDVLWELLCFHAQQAAEKALKAALLRHGLEPGRTHDVVALTDALRANGVNVPAGVLRAGRLTEYAVMTRYPSASEAVTAEEYEEALALAEVVVSWAERVVGE